MTCVAFVDASIYTWPICGPSASKTAPLRRPQSWDLNHHPNASWMYLCSALKPFNGDPIISGTMKWLSLKWSFSFDCIEENEVFIFLFIVELSAVKISWRTTTRWSHSLESCCHSEVCNLWYYWNCTDTFTKTYMLTNHICQPTSAGGGRICCSPRKSFST